MAKYQITFRCGHTEQREIGGSQDDQRRKAAWMAENMLCSECHRAEQERLQAAAIDDSVEWWNLTNYGSEPANRRIVSILIQVSVRDGQAAWVAWAAADGDRADKMRQNFRKTQERRAARQGTEEASAGRFLARVRMSKAQVRWIAEGCKEG